jgi:hypothetical protein
MRRFELVSAIQDLIRTTNEALVDVMDNYNMGLITFHEYSFQMVDINMEYREKLNSLIDSVMEEERVTLEFIKGYLAHDSIGC